MLTDEQVIACRADPTYRKAVRLGMKGIVGDTIAERLDDPLNLPTNPVAGFAWSMRMYRARVIKKELCDTAAALLEALANGAIQVDVQAVKTICSAPEKGFTWMRFDEIRLKKLFLRLDALLLMPEVRTALKSHSTLVHTEADARLSDLRQEASALGLSCLKHFRALAAARMAQDHLRDEYADEAVTLFEANVRPQTPIEEVAGETVAGLEPGSRSQRQIPPITPVEGGDDV